MDPGPDVVDYDVMEACQEAGIAAGVVQNAEDLFRRRRASLPIVPFFEEIPHFKKGVVTASGHPAWPDGYTRKNNAIRVECRPRQSCGAARDRRSLRVGD